MWNMTKYMLAPRDEKEVWKTLSYVDSYLFGVKGFRIYHFHNDFLNALTAGGLFEVFCWLTTIVLMLRKSLRDPASLCLLVGFLSVGLTERYWFHRLTLFSFVTIWSLLYLSKPQKNSISNQ